MMNIDKKDHRGFGLGGLGIYKIIQRPEGP